ncbi:class I SAM-dependent RNA methyltransferase [Gordonia sp. TBRC 11910]|uniref:Class I SAM-dependent RNA methyltransferase n=1 Tax=Gordonia asplenii TaxID=2725283 RepID=A0A848KPT8_9ACTN|nr:TRAM domain-containing protein [Gordonia asplenii]NMN99956.1 class I SAM-dependent RNA methyltransferase [Gordonia asplenii]
MSAPASTPRGAWSGRELEVTLDRLAHGGAAVGRVDGRVVFVRGALPGERVRALVVDDRKAAFCHADVVEIVEASPYRIDPACPAAAAGAGCCDLSFVSLPHLRDLKTEVLTDTLARVGRLPDVEASVRSLIGPDDPGAAWRVRARLSVDGQGYPGFHRHHGAQIVAEPCIALHPAMYATVRDQRYQPGSDVIVVRDTEAQVHVVEIPEESAPRRGHSRATAQRNRARSGRKTSHLVAGSATATFQVGRRRWEIPSTGFWQAHERAPQVYSDTIAELVAAHRPLSGGSTVWDLYGGAGVFTAGLLDAAAAGGVELGQMHIVDTDSTALDAAQTTLDDLRVHVHRGSAQAVVDGLPTPDVVVLDPPRSGAGREVVEAVADADPAIIVHIGCDVAAFARDLGLFADRGYRVVELRGFDAFPRTHHVEAIAALVPASG